jgi:hypothetical protein
MFFLTELLCSSVPGWHGGRLRVPVDYSPLDSGDGYTIYLSGIYLSVGRLPSSFYFPLLLLLLLFYLLLFFFLNTFFFFLSFYLSPDGLSWVTNLFTWLKRSSFVHLPPSSPLPPTIPSHNIVVHRLYPITSHNLKDKSLRLH